MTDLAEVDPAVAARGELPELRDSDGVNLADDRIECPGVDGVDGHTTCPLCHGRGHLVKPTGRDHLSHSALSAFLNCSQRYAFAYDARLEPVERSIPRALGRAYQKAIELADPEAGVNLLRQENPAGVDPKEEAIVRGASDLYLKTFGPAQVSEFEYRVRLRSPWTGMPSRSFDLLGYADGLDDKGVWWELVENKLVGQIQPVSIRKLPLDRQLALEAYGIWRATGKEVREVRYRLMKKPSIRQKQNETLNAYCSRVEDDYAERPEFYLHEEKLIRSNEDLVRIEAELWIWAEDLRASRKRNLWARNTSFCHEYGGCPFIPLCIGDPDAPSLYRARPERPVVAAVLPE